jgi:O-antigen/teichoic acid export membrane protein
VVLQGVKRFDITAAADVASAAVILTVQTLMVVLFGFYGMFAGLTASLLAMYAVWKRMGVVGWTKPVFNWRIDRSRVGELISFGAPIMIYGQIWILFMAVDSLIVATLLDVRQLGYYSLALSVTTYIMLVPSTIAAVLFPRMAEQFGQTRDIHAIGHYATRVQQVLSTTMVPALMGAGFFLVPVLIRHALPEFTPGIVVTQIIVAGTFFLAVSNMPRKLLYTAGYRWPLAAMMAGCLTFNAAVNLIAIAVLDLGIKGAAGATAASYFVVFMSSTVYALSKLASVREIVAHVGELVLLFLYAATAMYGIDALITPPTGLFADIAVSVGCYLLYLVLLVPCFVWGEKRYGGGRQIWSAVGGGWRRLRGGEATG